MTFIPKPNTGTLWPNKYKKGASHPDKKGDLNLDKDLLLSLIKKADGNLVKIAVAAWEKDINGQSCLSLSASEPYVKETPSAAPPQEDEDVPF